jgi:hypothetical protein
LNEAPSTGLHTGTKSLQVVTTRNADFDATASGRDRVPARFRQLTSMGRQALNKAPPAGPHADTKLLQVLTTRYAECDADARAGSRTTGLGNSCRHSKKHYDERPTNDSVYRHQGILSAGHAFRAFLLAIVSD